MGYTKVMADPASLTRSISEAVSRAISDMRQCTFSGKYNIIKLEPQSF